MTWIDDLVCREAFEEWADSTGNLAIKFNGAYNPQAWNAWEAAWQDRPNIDVLKRAALACELGLAYANKGELEKQKTKDTLAIAFALAALQKEIKRMEGE